ncbi:MAG: hypothetical protein ACLTDS_09310 [Bianqueaceae bacterium]
MKMHAGEARNSRTSGHTQPNFRRYRRTTMPAEKQDENARRLGAQQ